MDSETSKKRQRQSGAKENSFGLVQAQTEGGWGVGVQQQKLGEIDKIHRREEARTKSERR